MQIRSHLLAVVFFLVALAATALPARAALAHRGAGRATRFGEPGSYLLIGGGLLLVGALGSRAFRT